MQIQAPPGYQVVTTPDGRQMLVPIQQMQHPSQQGPPPQQWGPPPQQPGYPVPYQPPQQQAPPPNYGQPQPYGQPTGYPPPQQPPMPPSAYAQHQQQPTRPLAFHMPTPDEVRAAIERQNAQAQKMAEARAGLGGRKRRPELTFYGPTGQKSWDASVPIGYVAQAIFRILPSPIAGQQWFFESDKHFWKSRERPRGAGGWCPGQGCLLCSEWRAALNTGDEQRIKAAQWLKARPHRLYQGLRYGALEDHRREDGRIGPLIHDAPWAVHEGIGRLINERGAHMLLDPFRGMPVKITKEKTGQQAMDVKYGVLDLWDLAGPIPPEFGFGPQLEGLELYDLAALAKSQILTLEQQERGLSELGFRTPPPASYQAGPGQPPQQQAPQQPYGGYNQGGYQQPPVQQQVPQQPPPQQYAFGQSGPQQPLPVQNYGPPPGGHPAAQTQPPGPYGAPQQWGPPPQALPRGEPPPASYRPPPAQAEQDPWANQQQAPQGPPANWQPPPPPQQLPWGAPTNGPPQQTHGYGPAYPAPPGASAPPSDEPPF